MAEMRRSVYESKVLKKISVEERTELFKNIQCKKGQNKSGGAWGNTDHTFDTLKTNEE